MSCRATKEKYGIHQEAEAGWRMVQAPLLWILWVGKDEAQQAGLVLDTLNKFSKLWGIETVPNCLVPVLGKLEQVYSSSECESQINQVVMGVHVAAQEVELTRL